MCQNCQKMYKAQKIPKSPKTALLGLANKVPERSVSECSVCARVSIQAQTGPGALSTLLQLIPARSGPRSLAQLPRGPGRVPSMSRELPREVTRPRSLSQCPGMCPGEAQAKCYSSP